MICTTVSNTNPSILSYKQNSKVKYKNTSPISFFSLDIQFPLGNLWFILEVECIFF